MEAWSETHRSFVNTWECDENGHMNVQFYFKRFAEAARIFAMLGGGGDADGLPVTRNVRFHAELFAGAMTRIRSAVVADGALAGRPAHIMESVASGAVAATALDAPRADIAGPAVAAAEIAMAVPRSADAAPMRPMAHHAIIDAGGGPTNLGVVQPAECDGAGEMLPNFYVSRLSDGAPHAWQRSGMPVERLLARGLGRVAVEMKVAHHRPARAGDVLALCSRRIETNGKISKLHHEMTRLPDGAAILSAEVAVLVIDLATRKAVGREEIAARLR